MSDVRISQLNAALPLSGGEYIPITQMGLNGKLHTVYTTPDDLSSYAISRASNPSTDAVPVITPVGGVMVFAGDISNPNNVPTGWLVCDGTAYSKEQYNMLYAIIGDQYGISTDSSMFKVPDLRFRVVMGYNTVAATAVPTFGNWISTQSLALGTTDGEFNHQLSVDEMPSHTHSLDDPGHTHPSSTSSPLRDSRSGGDLHNYGGYVATQSAKTGITIAAAGGNVYHTNMQPFICMNYIIKY